MHSCGRVTICAVIVALCVCAPLPVLAATSGGTPAMSSGNSSGGSESVSRNSSRRRRRNHSCTQRLNQITYFDDIALRAHEQGKRAWRDSTWRHLESLETQLKKRCPEHYKERMRAMRVVRTGRRIKKWMDLAAKAAVKYFTGGLWPY